MKRVQATVAGTILCAILFLHPCNSSGQSQSQGMPGSSDAHIIRSAINNKSYQLHISVPKKYSPTDTIRYPVLYVLDGKFSFTSFSSMRDVLDLGKEINDIIIVAIADSSQLESDWVASRYYDFTPSSVPQSDTFWSKMMSIPDGRLRSGGAEIFLTALEKELIPYVEKNYKTNGDRGLWGHSLGGLFAGFCLIKKPALFKKYSINSPSFWWNNNEAIILENSYAVQNASISAKVFFSVGALEGDMMINPMTAFIDALKSHNYTDIVMTSQIFADETHLSVVPACSSRTLKVLYGTVAK